MDTLLIVLLSIGLVLFAIDMVLLRLVRVRNSLLEQMIPVLVDETLQTPRKQRALRRVELMKRGATVEIPFAGRSRIGTVHRARDGQRVIIMATNRHGKPFRVYRHLDKMRLVA